MTSSTIYDREAARYDAWYDSPAGRAIFAEELDAVSPLLARAPRPWLEIGVGTGRFAGALGVEIGIDPAVRALTRAVRRRVHVVVARGEALPFRSATIGAALIVVALSFVEDPLAVLTEVHRVLRPDGRLVIAEIPAEGPWGQHYRALAAQGHAYYRSAHFLTRDRLRSLITSAGFRLERSRAALVRSPVGEADGELSDGVAREGDDPVAGFLALLAIPEAR